MGKDTESETLLELGEPEVPTNFTNKDILLGRSIPAIDQLQIYSPEDFEKFVHEWLQGCYSETYVKFRRVGGAGDMGRDVIAYLDDPTQVSEYRWHNYQCKRYKDKLTPAVALLEIAKLLHYTYSGEFPPPTKYYFITTNDVGPGLVKLLSAPDKLRSKVLNDWDSVKDKITKKSSVLLDGDFKKYVESFDYKIFDSFSPQTLIHQHAQTIYHSLRFGGGLRETRQTPVTPPPQVADIESRYVEQLFKAYSEVVGEEIVDRSQAEEHGVLVRHFDRQREYFYHAESLREFAKETLPSNGQYAGLLDEVFHGIIDTVESQFENGFERVKEAVKVAQQIAIDSHPLKEEINIKDKSGMCHQLANDDKVSWVSEDEN